MIRLYRRHRVFWIDYSDSGRRIQRSLKTRDAQTARTLLRQIELEVLSGGKLRAVTWTDFEQEFLAWIEPQVKPRTRWLYGYYARRFREFLAGNALDRLDTIDPKTIAAFLEKRKADQHPSWKRARTQGGMRFELRHLRRIFSYAVERGYLAANPIPSKNLNAQAGKTLPFTQKDIDAMLADAQLRNDVQLRAIVLTFLHTGLRISDVINLRRDQIAGGQLIRPTQKRGRTVSLRIHREMRLALDAHLAAAPAGELVFASPSGRPLADLDHLLRRLWKRCGVSGGHAHRFRATFAVRLLQHGASLYDVAHLLGITAQTADRHYTPFVKELQERGADLLSRLDFVKIVVDKPKQVRLHSPRQQGG